MSKEKNTVELTDEELEKVSGGLLRYEEVYCTKCGYVSNSLLFMGVEGRVEIPNECAFCFEKNCMSTRIVQK